MTQREYKYVRMAIDYFMDEEPGLFSKGMDCLTELRKSYNKQGKRLKATKKGKERKAKGTE